MAQSGADDFIFSGNRHDSVPRALLQDRRLTPLERNAWQVFRLMLSDDGITTMPGYEQLAPWLAVMPCATRASHETVARALTLLRLTRWLSLVQRRRDPKTGRMLGNLYVLHDEPLTPFEAMRLDLDYLELVSRSLNHAAKTVQIIGINTLNEIAEDPLLSERTLPTRLHILTQRLIQQGIGLHESYPQNTSVHDSEEGQSSLLRNVEPLSSDSEEGLNPNKTDLLRNPNSDSTVRSSSIYKVHTTARTGVREDYRLPDRFHALKQAQQAGALVALRQVDCTLRQAVLDEWEARCCGGAVRNPAGYLFGIIQRAIRGEFNTWAGRTASAPTVTAACNAVAPPSKAAISPEAARQHIQRMRELLRK